MPIIEEFEEAETHSFFKNVSQVPIGETLEDSVMTKEALDTLLAPLEETATTAFRSFDFALFCVGDEVCEFVKKRNFELVERDNATVPHFRFRIPMENTRSEENIRLTLSKLFSLPLNAFQFHYLVEKNYHITFEMKDHLGSHNPFLVANTTRGLKEFEEYKSKVLSCSKNTGYFDLEKADQIIKQSETDTTIDWREKSKEIFKLEVSSESLTPEENEKWHQYFVDRVANQKKHNLHSSQESEYEEERIIPTTLAILKNTLSGLKDATTVADFCAQACFTYFSAGYIDVGALSSLDTVVRFYSTKSYESIDLKYTFFHKARYHSHDFLTRLVYRVLPLAVNDEEKLKENTWNLFFENYLDDDDRFQEHNWIVIEKRNFRIFLKQLKEFRNVLLGTDDNRYSKISDYQLLNAMFYSSAVHSGDTTLVRDDWIGYNIRVMCGCPSESDYSYEAHDFDKDIEEQLKTMREGDDDDEDDDDDENFEDVDEDDDDYEDIDEFADGNANEVMNQFLQELAFGGGQKKNKRSQELPPGCPQQ